MANLAPVRIEPQMLTAPGMFGSAGEPSIGVMPSRMSTGAPAGIGMSGGAPGLGLALPVGALAMGVFSEGLDRPHEPAVRRVEGRIRAPDLKSIQREIEKLPFTGAFALARGSGLAEFTWRGRRFHTRLREEV